MLYFYSPLYCLSAIPALRPVVYDLFLLRGTVKSEVGKDLETQREVVVSMLLRLVHCYQVSVATV